jgi:Zn ribbon nucleic-acid-binding protein
MSGPYTAAAWCQRCQISDTADVWYIREEGFVIANVYRCRVCGFYWIDEVGHGGTS